jgi:hypothetical protein
MNPVYEVEAILDEAIIDSTYVPIQTSHTTSLSGRTTPTSTTPGNLSPISKTLLSFCSNGSGNGGSEHLAIAKSRVKQSSNL